MSTAVDPNAMQMTMAQPPEPPKAMAKAFDDAEMALARVYKHCHMIAPDSPLCDAIMSIQKALVEVEKSAISPEAQMGEQAPPEEPMPAEMGAEEAPLPPEEAGMPMEEEMPMEEGPAPVDMADAAGQTRQMMQAAAKRRLQG